MMRIKNSVKKTKCFPNYYQFANSLMAVLLNFVYYESVLTGFTVQTIGI